MRRNPVYYVNVAVAQACLLVIAYCLFHDCCQCVMVMLLNELSDFRVMLRYSQYCSCIVVWLHSCWIVYTTAGVQSMYSWDETRC